MTEAASGYDRADLEKYYTPEWAVVAALASLKLSPYRILYDPAAGDGAVLRAAWSVGHPAAGADISPDANGIEQGDFLTDHRARSVVLTNPPYGDGGRLAVKFIKHALDVTKSLNGVVCMLLRADFDSAPGRVDIFRDHPAFAARLVMLKRLKWTNVEQKPGKGPSTNHTWYVWDWSRPRVLPVVRYIA